MVSASPKSEVNKLRLLLEFANERNFRHSPESAMEPVPSQSPCFARRRGSDPNQVRLHFSAPAGSATTRGFASILAAGLDNNRPPTSWRCRDFYTELGLAALISPAVAGNVGDAGPDQARRLLKRTESRTA